MIFNLNPFIRGPRKNLISVAEAVITWCAGDDPVFAPTFSSAVFLDAVQTYALAEQLSGEDERQARDRVLAADTYAGDRLRRALEILRQREKQGSTNAAEMIMEAASVAS